MRRVVSARADQDAEEDTALDVFRRASGLLPGAVTRVQPDPPDFLIAVGARRVSVEMTRYHQDSGAGGSEGAKHEALERRVLAAAQTHFEESNPNVHIRVSPYFREGTLRKTNVRQTAEQVAKVVSQVIPSAPSDAKPLTSKRADWDIFDRAGLGQVLINLTAYRAGNEPG